MKFNHTAHKALWNWLAENPHMEKEDWPGWEENGGHFSAWSDCFACDYDIDSPLALCGACPLDWGVFSHTYCCKSAAYGQWCDEELGTKLRSDLARQIANLPVKPGVECE